MRSVRPVQILGDFLNSANAQFVPGDFSLSPHSVTHVRLLFRNSYGITIRFVSEETVSIEGSFVSFPLSQTRRCQSSLTEIFAALYVPFLT